MIKCLDFLGYPDYNVYITGTIYSYLSNAWISHLSEKGYYSVILTNNKVSKVFKLHRLIALAFIPNPNNLPEVNHKDGNKANNHVNNLEWCTCHENITHACNTGLRSGNALSVQMVHKVCKMLQQGYSNYEIGIQLNIDPIVPMNIKRGIVHKEISKQYDFSNVYKYRKLSDAQIHEICRMIQIGYAPSKIAIIMNINVQFVYDIKFKHSGKHISINYDFKNAFTKYKQ